MTDNDYRAATHRIAALIDNAHISGSGEIPGEALLEPHGLSGAHVPDLQRLAHEVVVLLSERALVQSARRIAEYELKREQAERAAEERSHNAEVEAQSGTIVDLIELCESTMRVVRLLATYQPRWRVRLRRRLRAIAGRIESRIGGVGDPGFQGRVMDRIRREEQLP